jgi:hypothetical protein
VLNLFSDEVRRNPNPLYDQLRSASPVLWKVFRELPVSSQVSLTPEVPETPDGGRIDIFPPGGK